MPILPALDLPSHDATIDFDTSITAELPKSKPSPDPATESKPKSDDAGSTITVSTKAPTVPPPKTDKPRPHVCTTCERCFARLEHLKRHERSHTKEKPFECAQCTRCFARRDLLLRHQQKLHQATTPAARPRNRRESTASAAAGRARKNSIAGINGGPGAAAENSSAANARPRANTTGHVDGACSLATFASNVPLARRLGTANLADFNMHHPMSFSPSCTMAYSSATNPAIMGMPSLLAQRGLNHGPPKLETQLSDNLDFSGGLRTAPAMSYFNQDFDFETAIFGSTGGNTINPSALHADSPQSLALDPTSAFARRAGAYNDMPSTRDSFDWLTGFENQMSFISANESAVDGSSPSAISTGSQSDVMLDGSTHLHNNGSVSMPPPVSAISSAGHSVPTTLPTSMWQSSGALGCARPLTDSGFLGAHPPADNSFSTELGMTDFSDLLTGISVSPHMAVSALGLQTNQTAQATQAPLSSNVTASSRTGDPYFSTPPPSMSSLSPSLLNMNASALGQTMGLGGGNGPDTPMSLSGSSGSVSSNGNNAASGGSSSPVSTITDATRLAIVKALTSAASRNSSFGIRRYSFSGIGSPNATGLMPGLEHPVPATSDLRRYVAAYLQNVQPFMPFLHVATLSFDVSSSMLAALTSHGRNNSIGASGCLVLSMAAIGALFELDREQSRILFNMAKRMIQVYLDERRKANVRRADYRRPSVGEPADDSSDTPVWLVQAMLLNVMYGHNSADMRACEIASTHSAALASLAHGADLLKPVRLEPLPDVPVDIWGDSPTEKTPQRLAEEKTYWLKWKSMEERKRTLFAVFVLSSLFMSAYNHTPVLTNSEILLDLPCDEAFFAAASSAEFESLGGVAAANHNRMTFHEALGSLLRSSEKQMQRNILNSMGSKGAREALEKLAANSASELKPSRFGCNILINALHNYIWETRQRHHNKFWTNEETEKMHRHIEPALEAWQVAWKSSAQNSTDFQEGLYGPLSTNSMPLLDLAYVRLFVNLGPSKHKFWQRDWDGLAEEISHGWEIVQHAEQSPVSNAESMATDPSSEASGHNSSIFADSPATQHSESPGFGTSAFGHPQQKSSPSRSTSRREKHLRKAAYYAASSMTATDRLGLTLTGLSTGALPLHVALCFFDCTQVLAEWVATVQDRVGPYLGILGRDEVDLSQVPAIMMLDDEDVRLLGRIQEFLTMAEGATNLDLSNGGSGGISLGMQMGEQIGFAAKILSTTAALLGRAHVWPALMVECLETHAAHMRTRAEKSVLGQHFSQ